MKKRIILSLVLTVLFISSIFPKDKLSEDSTSLAYSYTEWTDFYTDLIDASKNNSYKYAFLRNSIVDEKITAILQASKENAWNLYSYKGLQGRDMIYAFCVVSPNSHKTILILSNNSVEANRYEIANKSYVVAMSSTMSWSSFEESSPKKTSTTKKADTEKSNEDNTNEEFLKKISSAFDEQLVFFDEEVPLKLVDFSNKKTSQSKK